MIEKEYKVILNKEQYEKILNSFEFLEPVVQINFYYKENKSRFIDTTIRVRFKDKKIKLQVKELISIRNGIYVRREYEKSLKEVPLIIKGKTLNELCESNRYQDCLFIGVLITERRVIHINDCEMALDINHYCGITDYELEIEFEKEIDSGILEFLNSEKIYKNQVVKGKYERFVMHNQETK